MSGADLSTSDCTIPEEAYRLIRDGQGVYFEPLIGLTPDDFAADTLTPSRAEANAKLVQRFTPLEGKHVLEIGAGAGVNLALWTKKFGIDGWALEPEQGGFDDGAAAARAVFEANNIPADRLVDAPGEAMPFETDHFDLVFSVNALEHTDIPARVVAEAIRVVKPGGWVILNCPNYLSVYDGHYDTFHPPVLWNGLFRFWVKYVAGKDPAFAATLRTEINAIWAKRLLKKLNAHYRFEIVTLGQDIFRERLKEADVPDLHGMGAVRRAAVWAKNKGITSVLADIMIAAHMWTPLIIVVRKSDPSE